jgi:RNA polymerase sporulation-specific sigma factor
MKEYWKENDEMILQWIEQGDSLAMDFLIRKYTADVKKEARRLYLIGGDEEDLIQEGMIGLFQAIRDYKKEKESSFSSFARLCILRQMYSAVTASNRKKHQPLNSYISLEELAFSGQSDRVLEETISMDEKNSNPEKIMLDKEQAVMIESVIVERLSTYEKKVFELYLQGLSYENIAEELRKSRKGIDNAIQRIRRKFSLFFEEEQ